MNQNAVRKLSYGVYIISTWDKGRPTGCVANSTMQITSDPATIAVSINHSNYTNEVISKVGRFSVSVLSEQSDPSLIGTFGFQSGRDVDKFEGVPFEVKGYMPVIKDSCAYMSCEVVGKMETDTHTVFLGKVVDMDIMKDETPMTYAYYHNVVKGKSPKTAPTYVPEEEVTSDKYICNICGYIYDGDTPFEELPEDYKCPLCKQPKSVFRKEG